MTDERWFSYDNGGNGFEIHESQEAAKKSAQDAMDYYQGNADDGWDESSDSVCWGRVYQEVAVVDSRPRTESDFVASWITHIEDRVLVDAGEAEAIEALRRRVAELEEKNCQLKATRGALIDAFTCVEYAFAAITAENAELKRQVEALREVVTMILEAEMPDCKSQEEFGGYVLDDSIREKAKTALRESAKGEVEDEQD